MKNKLKWLVNLSTLILCVCALAIGVYAAKQASLTTTGQIGFKAHNCEVILSGTIDAYQSGGDTVLNKEQDIKTYTTTGGKIGNTQIGGTNGVTTLNLPAMYFSDVNDDGNKITLNLTTANQSAYDVKAKISVAGDMPTSVTCTISEDNYVMGALNSTTDEKSFTITFTLSNPTTSADFGDTDFSVVMEFAKYEVSYKSNITVNTFTQAEIDVIEGNATAGTTGLGDVQCPDLGCEKVIDMDVTPSYLDRFPYYITLGKEVATGNALKWLIVGVDNNGAIAPLEKEDTDAFADKKMLDKNYYLLSEKVLYAGAESEKATYGEYGIAFQNTYTDTSASGYENASGKPANDYATSSIRQYLKDKPVCRETDRWSSSPNYVGETGTEVSFATNYTITQAEYDLIQARSLYDMYSKDGQSTTDLANESDKLWLLSETEFATLFGNDKISCSVCGETVYSSARCAVQGADATSAFWWLRSPYVSFAFYACDVDSNGSSGIDSVCLATRGVRPAIKLA